MLKEIANHNKLPIEIGHGEYAKVELGTTEGKRIITKQFHFDQLDMPVSELIGSLVTYRDLIGTIYAVPELIDISQHGQNGFSIKEQFIEGNGGHQITRQGNFGHLQVLASAIFTPLFTGRLSPTDFHDPEYFARKSNYPVAIPVDTKPDNFIVDSSRGLLYYVDFMPPRLRGEDGMLYPISSALDSRTQTMQTHHYGDLSVLMARFWTHCAHRYRPGNVEFTDYVGSIGTLFTESVLQLDPLKGLLVDIRNYLQADEIRTKRYFDKGEELRKIWEIFNEKLIEK